MSTLRPLLHAAVAAALVGGVCGAGPAAGAGRSVIVVDDDGVQCPGRDVATLQEAVDRSRAGGLVRVCPGRYVERVVVDRPLTLQGQPDVVEGVDCFDPTLSDPPGVDPTLVPVIERPPLDAGAVDAVTLAADDVTMRGFVVQGALNRDGDYVSSGIATDARYSGYRVSHNLLRNNALGIDFGSNGAARSRVDHNCLRDNDFGLAAQRGDLVHGLVDGNETFRTGLIPYELGWFLASVRSTVVRDNVVDLAGNDALRVENAQGVTLVGNHITRTARGVTIYGGSADIAVRANRIQRTDGIAILFQPPGQVAGISRRASVVDNVIEDIGQAPTVATGIAVARSATAGSVDGLLITGNEVRRSNGIGISVQPLNPGVVVWGNVIRDNAVYGVIARPGTTGVRFRSNLMIGNGTFDAVDQGVGNVWEGNVCTTDQPTGAVCGVG